MTVVPSKIMIRIIFSKWRYICSGCPHFRNRGPGGYISSGRLVIVLPSSFWSRLRVWGLWGVDKVMKPAATALSYKVVMAQRHPPKTTMHNYNLKIINMACRSLLFPLSILLLLYSFILLLAYRRWSPAVQNISPEPKNASCSLLDSYLHELTPKRQNKKSLRCHAFV